MEMEKSSARDQNLSPVAPVSLSDVKFQGETENSADGLQGARDFTNISLEGVPSKKKEKVPKRILHFSDGILEEYSTDEEEQEEAPAINPKTLTWLPWFWYYMMSAGFGALSVADTCGEKLAWFFGITSPKYQYAIDEHKRMKREVQEELDREEREAAADMSRRAKEMADMEGAHSSAAHGTSQAPTLHQPKAAITQAQLQNTQRF